MDFQSPLGGVRGLSGEIDFTSLAPLIATPGQTLRVESLQTIAPVTDATVTFGLKDGVLSVTDGEAAVSGGRVRIETLEVPLAADQPVRGVLLLDGAQLHDLVEASPFGDQVELDARVSGRVPFETRGSRVRILGGELKAMQPGHLSIRRTALTGVAAVGGVAKGLHAAPPPATSETFTDFAYQAMENLAFTRLDATISSHEDGRMGVLFHIVGRHDPPQRQEIRLSLTQLLGRKFLGRQLPLPSDTGVDLTLDTTLNLDDLLADYIEYQRLRGLGPVQP